MEVSLYVEVFKIILRTEKKQKMKEYTKSSVALEFKPIQRKKKFLSVKVMHWYESVNPENDKRIQSCSFRDGEVGVSGHVSTQNTFATSRLTGFQFLCINHKLGCLEMRSPLQVKSYRD